MVAKKMKWGEGEDNGMYRVSEEMKRFNEERDVVSEPGCTAGEAV